MTDNISHEFLQRTAKAHRSYLLRQLRANAFAIATWTEELGQIAEWDLPSAEAIRRHIVVLAENHVRIMGLPEDTAGDWDNEEVWQGLRPTWEAIEAHLPRERMLEIKRSINRAFASSAKGGGEPWEFDVINEHGGLLDALKAALKSNPSNPEETKP